MAKKSRARRSSYSSREYESKRTKNGSSKKRNNESAQIVELNAHLQNFDTAYSPRQDKAPLKPRTSAQKAYINAIKNNMLTFGIGPAGTGKSYCAGALAAEALESGSIERIILTRPAVEAGENLGFLPGDLDEKFAAYIDAFRDILNERLGAGTVNYCLRHGRIVAAPLAYMRGKTFNEDTFVILDEAQNTTPEQMKMFLTRIGENCKVVVNGDVKQSDIKGRNGLSDAIERVEGLPGVHIHEFERHDIVRSGLVRELMERYEVTSE
ncbi:PhoH family protein [Agarilytica rhodophyticola]|uniref:PhoH family protein n=1 Tax=Agarilytica rhodophyticola TaxID=1737490 RepID=UPI000B342CEB|nr:PhoH family protein [Agarilytica rhodophyticola]